MQISDRVYGEVAITEPVLCDLISSPTLQRLKDIDQAGYFEPYFPGTKYSRFEHSVGVCALLARYGAPLEEQIAGLIHDVSHSAFSHCIDYVLDAGSETAQDHQDNVFESYVQKSEIPLMLAAHGFDVAYILDDVNFPLKENSLPDLCADRIDYSLRSARVYGEIADAEDILHALTAEDGRWVFNDYAPARQYAELFRTINTRYYAGLESARMFRTVGNYLRHALQKGYITEQDLYTTDSIVLSRIAAHHSDDAYLQCLFEVMNGSTVKKDEWDVSETMVCCKSRIVDPLCRQNGVVQRVSDVDPAWKEVLVRESVPRCHRVTSV